MTSASRSAAALIIGAVALTGIVTWTAYHRDITKARSAALAGSSVVATPCGPVEYAERGAGAPVLSLHGTGGGWDQGLFLARGLPERGFRVVAPSRNGYLRTPMPDAPSPQKEATTFACFLDALRIDKVAVIAASAGATPALQFALQYPDRVSSLILLVPAVGGILPADTADIVSPVIMNVVLGSDFPYWLAMKVWPRAMLTVVAVPASLVPQVSDGAREDLSEAIRMILPVTLRRAGILYDANNQKSEMPYPLKTVQVPTMLISAKDDLYGTIVNARAAASAIPGARLLEFESGGHLLLDRNTELWPRVAEFINSARPAIAAASHPAIDYLSVTSPPKTNVRLEKNAGTSSRLE
jgi:2-hydroxy-6-oxonona-2,4-dienedioate hydrolase